jgi:hypothetical protein
LERLILSNNKEGDKVVLLVLGFFVFACFFKQEKKRNEKEKTS